MDGERKQFGDRRWALIPLMSGALRSGLILPLTISLRAMGLLTFGLAVLASTMFFVAVSQLDIVFLGGFHGSAGAGAYAPVSGIASAIGALFAILASYALPAMTAARIRGKDADLLDLTRWTSRWRPVLCGPHGLVAQ